MIKQSPGEVPIFLLLKTPEVIEHFNSLFHKLMWKFNLCADVPELLKKVSNFSRAIVFLEGVIPKQEGTNIYKEILDNCPGAKIVLVCNRNHRNLVKEMIEKGGYGSIIEPYDPWEITTMVKHLIADLSEVDGSQ